MEIDQAIQKNVRDSMQAQIESLLLSKIASDTWPVGAKIPSERERAV